MSTMTNGHNFNRCFYIVHTVMRGMCHDVATYKKPIYKNQEAKIK